MAFYQERNALITEWCRYLPLADVLDLTLSDTASELTFTDAATLCMKRYPKVAIPRDLVHRTHRWKGQGPLFVDPVFFGVRGCKLDVRYFADLPT